MPSEQEPFGDNFDFQPIGRQQGSNGDLTDPGANLAQDSEGKLEDLAEEARSLRGVGVELADNGESQAADGTSTKKRRTIAPAAGERNAVVGYLGQYELAAARTLAALREGSLEAVRVADDEAGQMDDFQLQSPDQVDAHQVKWSLHPGNIGYAEFVNDGQDRTRYMRQLADGWERLTALHHPRRVVVHFVTNDVPSSGTSKSIPQPEVAGHSSKFKRARSFAAFLAEAWYPAVEATRGGNDPVIPPQWASAMAAFAKASGLSDEMWWRFVADCELEFNVPSVLSSIASAPMSDAERAVLSKDTHVLAHVYMRLVARPDRRVEFTREQLLEEVGWRFRAEFKNPHEFPDPEIPYRSVAETARDVSTAIERFAGGYIAIIGSPGSGKSTLLTKTLRDSPYRVVRYYAYVRDVVGGNLRRGEAINFFHDLTVALERSGLRTGSTLPVDNLDLLMRRVQAQLLQAHNEWLAGGRRTIILVDGLDHIPREQHPTESLLARLPLPEDVPDGVLFILGTQTDRLQSISSRIRAQLDEQGRRITMRPLERLDVLEIVEATAGLEPAPSPSERDHIFTLSGGHPLALNYIINRLRHPSGATVTDTLVAVEPFREGIDQQYATIWGIVEDDYDLAHLLALLARARGPVRLDWMRHWVPGQAVHSVTTRYAYLFRQDRTGRWTFFHNSFRAFLIECTRELLALGGEAELFTELANRCANPDTREPERADELYYRSQAGDSLRVLALADPSVFRQQFISGRSATTIDDDLALALDAAVAMRDVVALTRVLLCSAEFAQREYYVGQLPLAETWLELGDVDLALDTLREGASLRTSRETALNAAVALDSKGYSSEAHEIFSLAEPLDTLRGNGEPNDLPRHEMELLDAWIAVAPRFRPVPVLLEMIRHVRATPGELWQRDEPARDIEYQSRTEGRQYRLLMGLAASLDGLARWEEADVVRTELRSRDDAATWWFWAQSHAWHDALIAGELSRAEERFLVLHKALKEDSLQKGHLEPEARIAMAGGYIRLLRDESAAWQVLGPVEQPALVSDTSVDEEGGWGPFHQRFVLNRVLGALGDERSLDELVPDVSPSAARRAGMSNDAIALTTNFERGVAQLGRLIGRAWMGERLALSSFESQARVLVRLFPDHPQLVRGSYVVLRARTEFYTRLVEAAAAHGGECVNALQRLYETEWSDEARQDAWPVSLVRTLLSELLSVGAPKEWVQTWLARVEMLTFRIEDIESDLSEGVAQARIWAAFGDVVAARATLERVLGASFGNGTEDDQLSACLTWAVRANQDDPSRMPERLSQMAAAVHALEGTEAQGYVEPDLIEAGIAAGARPARALVEWALRNDVCEWVEAMATFIGGVAKRAPGAAETLSAFYRSLVLPFARAAKIEPVVHLSTALQSGAKSPELDALSEAIEVVALGSTRAVLREAITGRSEDARELLRNKDVSDPTAHDQVVNAFEGLSLTSQELQARVQSVSDVQDLADRLKPNAYFYRWDLILAPFLARATADELIAAAAAIPQNDYSWRAMAAIAERLLALCDSRAAAVVERVVESSRAAGWWKQYDGGSRLTAFELLVRVSPDGRRKAWEAIRKDVAAGEVRPMDVFRQWERVVAILAPDTASMDVWDVVSHHVEGLIAYSPEAEPVVIPAAEDPGDPEAAADAISGIAARYLDHPAQALAQGVQQFFVDRLIAGDAIAEAAIVARLEDADAPKGGALLVLRAVVCAGREVPISAHEALRTLRCASHYGDRRAAIALIGSDDLNATSATAFPLIQRPLPPVFDIIHPPVPRRRKRPLPKRGELLAPAEDAADLVSVFRAELDIIAEWADVQPEALYRYVADRAAAGMSAERPGFVIDDEKAVRAEMSRLGLRVIYRRPRPRRVESAMAEATAMLIDHGRIAERYLSGLDRLFRNSDPFFLITRPTQRPGAVAPIRERTDSKYVKDDWTAGVTTDNTLTGRTISDLARRAPSDPGVSDASHNPNVTNGTAGAIRDEWVVLAEETWLRWLDWKLATETRVGARLTRGIWASIAPYHDAEKAPDWDDFDGAIAAGQALDTHVADFSHLTKDEYLTRARSSNSIVVRNDTYRFETPGGRWLAFNPALAEHLGWRPAPDGVFRWLDGDGNVVAESVWWQDGFSQQRPPHFDDEVGYGWLVRVSTSGWRQLAATIGACVDWRRVARLAHEQSALGVVEWDKVAES